MKINNSISIRNLCRLMLIIATALILMVIMPHNSYAASHGSIKAGGTANDKIGDNLTWTLYEDGTLVIKGSGATYDYSEDKVSPLYRFHDDIKNIDLPAGITEIGYHVFEFTGSKGATLVLPESLLTIKTYAFQHSSFSKVVLPNSLQTIDNGAFYHCEYLSEFSIPRSFNPSFNSFHLVFGSCPISIITVHPDNDDYAVIDNVLFSKDKKKLLYYPAGLNATNYSVPKGVTEIANSAFWHNSKLVNISLPSSIETIRKDAFYQSTSLESINLPEGLQNIEPYAFAYCDSLKNIVLPSSLESLGSHSFEGCYSLKTIKIHEGLKTIDTDTFHGCKKLEIVDFPSSISKIGTYAFAWCTGIKKIIIRNKTCSVSAYLFTYGSKPSIYGFKGSTAQTFAEKENLDFFDLNAFDTTPIISFNDKLFTFDGQSHFPGDISVIVILDGKAVTLSSSDYTIEGTPQTEPGTYNFTVKLQNQFSGKATSSYTITSPTNPEVTLSETEYTYDGNIKTPEVTVTLAGKQLSSSYYTVSGASNKNPGRYDVNVTLKNGYSGTGKASYSIILRATPVITVSPEEYNYTGKAITPKFTVTADGLSVDSSHYDISDISNNKNPGEYTFTVTMKDCYEGSGTASYKIVKSGKLYLDLYPDVFTYNGKSKNPTPTILRDGEELDASDYTIKGLGEINAGTYKVTAVSKDGKDTLTAPYVIKKCSVKAKNIKVKLSKAKFTCNGKSQYPKVKNVTVGKKKLSDTAYKIKYSKNSKAPGTYIAKVTLKGNYKGSKKTIYTIVPQAITIKKIIPKKNEIVIKFSKLKNISGYQVQLESRKLDRQGNKTSHRCTLYDLRSKHKYGIRLRSYKKVGGKYYYSKWTKKISVKTK